LTSPRTPCGAPIFATQMRCAARAPVTAKRFFVRA
jgi:hypothetical protein